MLAMNSFMMLLTTPFADSRDVRPQTPPPLIYKALPGYVLPEPSRWGIWAAAYGGQNNAAGDPVAGSNDRSSRAYGSVIGLDYWVTPHTMVGVAVGGGGTSFGVADSLGGGHSDMFQSAVYSFSRFGGAYVAAALAYAWQPKRPADFRWWRAPTSSQPASLPTMSAAASKAAIALASATPSACRK
jgi:hypothetical protein